uniref:Putative secreted protein n=1 Tax=Anopheles darlingi TaxID=43151 RepID=A0A2M4DGS2_ANODA
MLFHRLSFALGAGFGSSFLERTGTACQPSSSSSALRLPSDPRGLFVPSSSPGVSRFLFSILAFGVS